MLYAIMIAEVTCMSRQLSMDFQFGLNTVLYLINIALLIGFVIFIVLILRLLYKRLTCPCRTCQEKCPHKTKDKKNPPAL